MIDQYEHTFEYENKLEPFETKIIIEAYLGKTKNLVRPNYCDDYYFTFTPSTIQDHQRLCEKGEQVIRDYLVRRHPWDNEPQANWELRNGDFFVQQPRTFSAPKLNIDERDLEMLQSSVTLVLHFHDTKDGRIYLSCDYVNAYVESVEEMEARIQRNRDAEPLPPDYDPDDDW